MSKQSKPDKLPAWLVENIPEELTSSRMFEFKVTVARDRQGKPTRVIPVKLAHLLDLDMDVLEEQMENLPAQYGWLASLYSHARRSAGDLERRVKSLRGHAVEAVKRRGHSEGLRLTADQVKQIAEKDADLCECEKQLSVAQMEVGKLYHALEALKMKSELARSLAGFKRQDRIDP